MRIVVADNARETEKLREGIASLLEEPPSPSDLDGLLRHATQFGVPLSGDLVNELHAQQARYLALARTASPTTTTFRPHPVAWLLVAQIC